MSLATGEPLGRYQVLAPIGAGGMGEVIARAIPASADLSRSK